MALIKKYKAGEFCWADLGTKDVAKAKKFYRTLLGLKAKDMPMGDGSYYSMLRIQEKDICALYPMDPELRKMKAAPFWLPYVSVRSIEVTVKKAKAAGGALCFGPVDVFESGRLAVLQDPTGARFALWQPRRHIGTRLKQTPGTVCWHDLSTPDRAAATKFYGKVFGWKVQTMDFSGNAYYLFKLGREGIGGMWPVPLPKSPPSWYTYWVVKNCAKAVARAKKLRAKIVLGPITVPDTCTFAIIQDPQGAAFGVLQPH